MVLTDYWRILGFWQMVKIFFRECCSRVYIITPGSTLDACPFRLIWCAYWIPLKMCKAKKHYPWYLLPWKILFFVQNANVFFPLFKCIWCWTGVTAIYWKLLLGFREKHLFSKCLGSSIYSFMRSHTQHGKRPNCGWEVLGGHLWVSSPPPVFPTHRWPSSPLGPQVWGRGYGELSV